MEFIRNFKYKKILSIFVLSVLILLLLINHNRLLEIYKVKKIESYISKIKKNYDKEDEIINKLETLEQDSSKNISQKATETIEIVEKLIEDNDSYEYAVSKIDEGVNNITTKNNLISVLSSIDKNSENYKKAQELIDDLSNVKISSNLNKEDKNKESLISIEYYTKHSTAGSEKLNIKLKNTSGKDIEYLALDILEVDSDDNVVNSDWTNTSALILDDATISLNTYFDYQRSESDLEFKIKDIKYK